MERTNRNKNIKVGIAALVGIALLMASYWFVGAFRVNAGTYTIDILFRDAQGLQPGTPVMMAGIKVGVVEKVALTDAGKALMTVRVQNAVEIPKDSQVRISSVSLLGDKFVEFVPGLPGRGKLTSGRTLVGTSPATLDDLLVQVNDILPQVSTLLTRLDSVGASAEELVKDPQMRQGVYSILNNLNMASLGATQLVNDLRSMAGENRDEVNQITANLASAMGNMNAVAVQINEILSGMDRNDLKQVMADFRESSRQIQQATVQVNEAAAQVNKLAGDEQIHSDLKTSIQNIREATDSAKSAIENLSRRFGGGASTTQAAPKPIPPKVQGAKVDFLYDAGKGEPRIDANYTAVVGDTLVKGGVYDAGETAKINLQGGKITSDGVALRFGLYQSRVGLGYDWQASKNFLLQADAYRPNEPRLDIHGTLDINESTGARIGLENIGGDLRPVGGIQYKF